jgi:hemoglobin
MYRNCYDFRDLKFIKARERIMTTKIARVFIGLAFTLMSGVISLTAFAGDDEAAGPSLYERLGEMDGIRQIVTDTIVLHRKNPEIAHFFDGIDDEQLIGHVTAFFAAGTGGPANYEGRDMTATHASMDMSDADFDSAASDVAAAAAANGVDADSIAEVGAILESLRPAVMGTAAET